MEPATILIDGREFSLNRMTGIGRFLTGILDALGEAVFTPNIILAVFNREAVPARLKGRKTIRIVEISSQFIRSEKRLSKLSQTKADVYISPYPKLPIFGCYCPSVNTVHDILDLTHPSYKNRLRNLFDQFRLRSALKKASLTWYVSSWSLKETQQKIGLSGQNPKVRLNGLAEEFRPPDRQSVLLVLKKYKLNSGYILIVGNGSPHKNLGVLLQSSNQSKRPFLFVGVSDKNRHYWENIYPGRNCRWIQHIHEEDLQGIIGGSFCLALPSTAEGYGYPPLEAMASGIPAVVSNIPVLKETTGGCALVADPYKPESWFEAFGVLENKSFYQNQVRIGLEWVVPLRGRGGWDNHVADIEKLIMNR